jgi:hypothetical protein
MIVVKIKLWPKDTGKCAREIGRTYLYNDGGTDDRGDYEVKMYRGGRLDVATQDIVTGNGFMRGRQDRGLSATRLQCVAACYPGAHSGVP